MEFNVAALTALCLGFSVGFLFVISYIERPILPALSVPERAVEYEEDIRGIHAFLAAFISHGGPHLLIPFLLAATGFSVWQTVTRSFDVPSLFVMVGLIIILAVLIAVALPAGRKVAEVGAYDEELEDVSKALFRLVRLHHNAFLALMPLCAAQIIILFL
ncbi:MAG: hypothetical protein AAF667_10815 [Pseudomonadota bacterium]